MKSLFRMVVWFQFSQVCYSPMIYSRQVNDNANEYTVWLSWHVASHSNNTCQVMLYVIVETEYCQNQEKHDYYCNINFITRRLVIQIGNGNSRSILKTYDTVFIVCLLVTTWTLMRDMPKLLKLKYLKLFIKVLSLNGIEIITEHFG